MIARRRSGTIAFDAARAGRMRARIRALIERWPQAQAVPQGAHLSLEVRKKRFGWFLADHHGDGRLALHFRTSDPAVAELEREMPENVHVPKYVGHRGWIGLWLDSPAVKWQLVRAALSDAYLLAAPASLQGKRARATPS